MTRARGTGLAARLFLAQVLVAVAGAATLWLVASAVGPTIFHDHLRRVAGAVSAQTSLHVEEAFRSASALSITVALLASLTAGLAVSAYVTHRIAVPVGRLAQAARALAAGRFDTRVTIPAIGAEFATLTDSFNAMASRLESIETTRRRLLADLAHEMRTPVATLAGYLEGLEDGVVSVDSATVGVLRAQTARLARLAEDITAVSLAEEHRLDLHLRAVPVDQLVAAAVDGVREGFADKGVGLFAHVGAGLGSVLADPDRIGQVLTNLLGNALRHTPPSGSVTVSARVSGSRDTVELAVSDTGEGIPPSHLPHIFERFYRVDRARDRAHGGSGIGLAIVKALVEAHGGEVSAVSAGPGRGSIFTISLPVSAPEPTP